MDFPDGKEYKKTIEEIAATGVKIMVTELDRIALPVPDPNTGADVAAGFEYKKEIHPYAGGLPDSVSYAWINRVSEFLRLFVKHRDKISRVTAGQVVVGL